MDFVEIVINSVTFQQFRFAYKSESSKIFSMSTLKGFSKFLEV